MKAKSVVFHPSLILIVRNAADELIMGSCRCISVREDWKALGKIQSE
jgi:hypothetical protein